ncbi:MAG: cytochrome c biogenesis protein ResB [Planctomycetota bacterium]
MNSILRFGRLFWQVFSSTKTAIFVIIVMGVMLGYGTIVESRHNSNDYAQAVVYHTWWYRSWICVFLVNLLCGTLKKWPWRLSQVPWLCTHLSILLILTGATLTHFLGENGTVEIEEGKSTEEYIINQNILQVQFLREVNPKTSLPRTYQFFTNFHIFNTDLTPDQTFEIPEKKFKLKVTKFLPFPEEAEHYMEDSDASIPNPAILLKLTTPTNSKELWMVSDPQHEKNLFRWGQFSLYFEQQNLDLHSPESFIEETQKRLDSIMAEATLGTLRVAWKEGDQLKSKDIVLKPDQFQRPHTFGPVTLNCLDFWPELGMEPGREPFMRGVEPIRPALKVQLSGSKGLEFYRVVEPLDADHPTEEKEHTFEPLYENVKLAYLLPTNPEHLGKDEIIFLKDTNKLTLETAHEDIFVVLRSRFNQFSVKRLSLSTPIPIQTGYFLELKDAKAKALEARKIKSKAYGLSTQPLIAFSVEGVSESPQKPFFLTLGRTFSAGSSRTITYQGEPVRISYLQHVKPLGFRIQLNKFIKEDYEGSDRAKSFESQVSVFDSETKKEEPQRIYMNNTLDYRGFRFFQSSYQKLENGSWKTILQINKDPGYIFLAVGWTFMALSMLALYYLKPHLIKMEQNRRSKKIEN